MKLETIYRAYKLASVRLALRENLIEEKEDNPFAFKDDIPEILERIARLSRQKHTFDKYVVNHLSEV